MYRHRLLPLLRNGLAEKQRVGLRFKADTAPKPQKADLQSIIPALRELLPVLPKRESDDANPNSHAPRRKRRGPLFYIALISPLFIWIEVENYFDPKPLLEKKRKQMLRERLGRLRDGNPKRVPDADVKSVLAYLRLLLPAMLPEDMLRNLHSEQVCDLLEEDCPEDFLTWLHQVSVATYDVSVAPANEAGEVKAAEKIQEAAEDILRRSWLAVHRRLPSLVDLPSDS
ncbi:hypothetical protein DFH08DRAFT_929778 [Mycena albidolilacea]|uniref:Uncharacterized protein n=1 Tax=Mycena albidolilacea TaxID=1033008 RepID=A0AAD7ASI2_9AGAR|nr:hypothetical protein DFH08DRAFT_929778 [Mycena albidolilacea]